MMRTTFLSLLAWPSLALASLADCNSPEPWRVLKASAPTAEAGAVFMDRQRIRWPGAAASDSRFVLEGPGFQQVLARADTAPSAEAAARHAYLGASTDLLLPAVAQGALPRWLQGPLLISERSPQGALRRQTALQTAGALDDLYAAAETAPALGALPTARSTRFRLWAPTATRVSLCLHPGAETAAQREVPLARQARTGIWSARLPADLSGQTYT
jgi:hypothetical protein